MVLSTPVFLVVFATVVVVLGAFIGLKFYSASKKLR
jgi:hypothetical protein